MDGGDKQLTPLLKHSEQRKCDASWKLWGSISPTFVIRFLLSSSLGYKIVARSASLKSSLNPYFILSSESTKIFKLKRTQPKTI